MRASEKIVKVPGEVHADRWELRYMTFDLQDM